MATSNRHDSSHGPRPRMWHEYDVVTHAANRFECDRRPITRSRAKRAIANGSIEDNPAAPDANEWRFRHRIEGLDVVVVCGGAQPSEGRYGNRIVTAFVDVVEASQAWVGTEWSKGDVHVAAMLQFLNAGYHDADVGGFNPYRVDVYEPVEYGGHILSWNEGHSEPFCHACRHEAIDGDDMFSPAGLAVALTRGCEIAVDDAPGIPTGTKIDADDLTCGLCGGSIDAPTASPAKWVAYNAIYNDGLCATCDPPSGEPWLAGLLFLFDTE